MSATPELEQSPLNKKISYSAKYSPQLLYPIERSLQRQQFEWNGKLPFYGADIWTGYELSWLNERGKPVQSLVTLSFPCTSPYLIESKSLKLYLNSFHQTSLASTEAVRQTLIHDLSQAAGEGVDVLLTELSAYEPGFAMPWQGTCLDTLDVDIHHYNVEPSLLSAGGAEVCEALYSDLLKSNCPVTGQPDWGSLFIRYTGPHIDHAGLLRYIISYRQHTDFAEHCVESIYDHLMRFCHPRELTVYARYVRRGGLDINPFRTNFEAVPPNTRLSRQ